MRHSYKHDADATDNHQHDLFVCLWYLPNLSSCTAMWYHLPSCYILDRRDGTSDSLYCSPAPRQSLAKKHETFIQHDDAHATDIHEHAFVRFVTLSYLPNSSPCTTTYFLKGPQRPSPLYQYLGWMVDIPLSKAVPSTPLLDTGQRSLARELDKKMPAWVMAGSTYPRHPRLYHARRLSSG